MEQLKRDTCNLTKKYWEIVRLFRHCTEIIFFRWSSEIFVEPAECHRDVKTYRDSRKVPWSLDLGLDSFIELFAALAIIFVRLALAS